MTESTIDLKIELFFYTFSKTCYIISFRQEILNIRIKRFKIQWLDEEKLYSKF